MKNNAQYRKLKTIFEIDFPNNRLIVESINNGQNRQAMEYMNRCIEKHYPDVNYQCDIYDVIELEDFLQSNE